jgi:AcrR family transcriptional regulator
MSPRAYNLGLRVAAAEQTRGRIITAAREILSDDDFDGLSIDEIARRAGVARMTVYYQFTSRRGLLEALYDDLAARGAIENLSQQTEEMGALPALDWLIESFTRFWSTDRLILRRLRGLSVIDQEIEAGIRQRDGRRVTLFSSLMRRIEAEDGWKAAIGVADAGHLIATLSGFDTYDALAVNEGDPETTAEIIKKSARTILGL